MAARPALRVRLVVNVARPHLDTSPEASLISAFARSFRTEQWPTDTRWPEVFYDPRALAIDRDRRASLHAKCVVVDDRWSLITSANFTEAAQDRNIEAGLLVDDPHLARSLRSQFDGLIAAGGLRRLALPD